MSRYQRFPACYAREPVPGMRVYGRAPDGRLALVVVHWVENGSVYGARRFRGERLRNFVRWPLCRWPLADWPGMVAGADVIGVLLPRPERTAVPNREVAR